MEHVVVSFQIDDHNDPWQDMGHVEADFCRKLQPVAAVGLLYEMFPSPSVFMGTEQKVYNRTKGKNIVGDNKVFQIHDICSGTQRLESGPHAESENAGDA